MSRGFNARTNVNTVPVNGEVREILRAIVTRMGTSTPQGRRAARILESGSKYMARRVLVDFARIVGVA